MINESVSLLGNQSLALWVDALPSLAKIQASDAENRPEAGRNCTEEVQKAVYYMGGLLTRISQRARSLPGSFQDL